jgi:hypothetical protein
VSNEFKLRAAEALADEVAVLVRRGVLDSRSPAADALLDFRDPPSSPRADRLAELEKLREDDIAEGRRQMYRELLGVRAPEDDWWLIHYDDADRPPEVIQGEAVARAAFAQRCVAWNCQLFRLVERADGEGAARG